MRPFTARLLNGDRNVHARLYPARPDSQVQNVTPIKTSLGGTAAGAPSSRGLVDGASLRTDAPPSEGLPEVTREQLAALDALVTDETPECELRPNGWLTVRLTTFDDGGRHVNWVDLAPDGTPYDIGNQEDS